MEDIKIKGIVKAVRKDCTGLLLLNNKNEEQWFKGVGNVLKYIKPELKGNEIMITLINQETHTFSYLEVLKENVQCNEKDDFWLRREEREIGKDQRMSKGASLNTAVTILSNCIVPYSVSADGFYSKSLTLAKIIYKEINGDDW